MNRALFAPAATVFDAGTVKAALLLDSVTTCPPAAATLFRVTVQLEVAPAATVAGLQETVAGATGATSDSEALAEVPFSVPVSCAVASVDTAATVTDPVTVALAWLLDRATLAPPAGAATLRVTVQLEVPAPVNDVGEQLTPLTLTCACTVTAAVRLTLLAVAVTVAF